ncbi:hypothetical protein [Calothrix sp. CCY 0018]|uniref:hypothetical protein n=1 Tax=Calothrix sp. CCY 0018 TaxID=3103864 RepID=UPI0039C6BD1B
MRAHLYSLVNVVHQAFAEYRPLIITQYGYLDGDRDPVLLNISIYQLPITHYQFPLTFSAESAISPS